MILALLVGCSVGDVLKLEDRACWKIGTLTRKIPWFSGMDEKKTEALISVLILILTSTTGIFGAMNEGITGDHFYSGNFCGKCGNHCTVYLYSAVGITNGAVFEWKYNFCIFERYDDWGFQSLRRNYYYCGGIQNIECISL